MYSMSKSQKFIFKDGASGLSLFISVKTEGFATYDHCKKARKKGMLCADMKNSFVKCAPG